MRKCFIAFDLDGTILPTIDTIADGTAEAVKMAIADGHRVMLASARPPSMTRWVYDALDLNTPMCNYNGALLNDPKGLVPTDETKFSTEFMADLIEKVVKLGISDFYIEDGDDFYTVNEPFTPYFKERKRLGNHKWITLDNIPVISAHRLVVYSPTDDIRKQVEALLSSYGFVFYYTFSSLSGGTRTIFNHASMSKWIAIQRMAAYYDIEPENIYTFGDEDNDYEMLLGAAHGYAMRNSAAHLKMGFTPTRLSCKDGGVADTIIHEILGK